MQVKVINALGEMMLLPRELSLQGWPMQADLPGVEIEGQHGQVIDTGSIRLKPRSIRVAGTLQGLSKDDADRIREMVAGFIYRANPLKLYRHELSERYMLVYGESIDHAYLTGRYGGRLFTLDIGFRAPEPFLLGPAQSVTMTTTEADIQNLGTAPASPIIKITGAISGPVVTNITTGQVLALDLVLGAAVGGRGLRQVHRTQRRDLGVGRSRRRIPDRRFQLGPGNQRDHGGRHGQPIRADRLDAAILLDIQGGMYDVRTS